MENIMKCPVYLFIVLPKAHHIIPKIVKIVSICSVQTDQVYLCVCMLSWLHWFKSFVRLCVLPDLLQRVRVCVIVLLLFGSFS